MVVMKCLFAVLLKRSRSLLLHLCRLYHHSQSRYAVRIKTRSPAVVRIADRTGCQQPSRSFKVDDFQFT